MSLLIRTNEPEFDLPHFPALPPIRYVLASAPRCGSNMLARALCHTGLAGFVDGYLSDAHVLDFFERWGFDSSDPAELERTHIRRLMACRTSPNGVFGIKIHGEQLSTLAVDLHELLLSPRYIWIRRRDSVRQAISYVLAQQTGVWIVDEVYLPTTKTVSEPRYSYAEIRHQIGQLARNSRIWEDYFRRHEITPHVVFYEDMIDHYEATLRGCLRHLDIEVPEHMPTPGLKRQASELTEKWVERFKLDDAHRSTTARSR